MSAATLPGTLAHLSPRVAAVVAEAKTGLEALYGERLAHVVLYGSQARGDARSDSDVDLLIVLHGEVRPYDEIKRTSELSYSFLLDREMFVSMQPYTVEAYETQQNTFMKNVRREGVTV